MLTKKRIGFLVAILLVFLLIGGLFALRSFTGGTKPDWNNVIRDEIAMEAREQAAAETAVRQSGTNILSRLIRMAGSQDSFITERLSKFRVGRFEIRNASEDQAFAVFGFVALGERAQPAIPQLENLLTNSPKDTSENAANCLSAIGKPAVPVLLREMTNANPTIRASATMAIGAVDPKSKESVPALMDRLNDESSNVRYMAAQSLGEIKAEPDVVLPALTALVRDPNSGLKHVAVRAIGNFGPEAKDAVDLLTPLLNDPDQLMRFEARQALRKINGEESQ